MRVLERHKETYTFQQFLKIKVNGIFIVSLFQPLKIMISLQKLD